jgi:hypothetical protein
MKCPYLNINCDKIDTLDMTKIECSECEHSKILTDVDLKQIEANDDLADVFPYKNCKSGHKK